MDIEELAAEAVTAPVNPRSTAHDVGAILERVGRQPITPKRLVKCPYCGGRGLTGSKWGHLWGYACWVCGGWGAVDPENVTLKGPSAPHPFR